LARADAVSFRAPYQSDASMRENINNGKTEFFDMHLSTVPQNVRYGFLGKFQWAIVEACDVNDSGEIVLSASVGVSPTYLRMADKILIELNRFHPASLRGFHDIYEPLDPPHRREIPVYACSDRIGSPVVKIDPKKIVGIVETNIPDEVGAFDEPNTVTKKIGENVAGFLAAEILAKRIPGGFLPIQSGVGNIANAVLGAMGDHPDIPAFDMYSEVIQDSVIDLMKQGKIKFASGCSLTVAPPVLKDVYANLDFYRPKIVLRPQEISNNPEVIRRLGIIAVNTALEVDIGGNVNSTHILGRKMMNGIGGSGDFARNAYLSIFTCPSTAKGDKISTIVPMVSHEDHSEHSVQVIVTEQGVADLRGKSPKEHARAIIDNCAHPAFRDQLHRYLDMSSLQHQPQVLRAAFAMHEQLAKTGSMHGVDWKEFQSVS
jgi:succinate CoA transferase